MSNSSVCLLLGHGDIGAAANHDSEAAGAEAALSWSAIQRIMTESSFKRRIVDVRSTKPRQSSPHMTISASNPISNRLVM